MTDGNAGDSPDEEEWVRVLDELDAAATAAEESGNPRAIAPAEIALAEHLLGAVESDILIDLYLTAREAYLEFDPDSASECLQVAGLLAQQMGDLESARAAYWTACEEYSDRGDLDKTAAALNDYGALSTQLGDYDESEEALRVAIEMYEDLNDPDGAAEVRLNRANNHHLSGRTAEAEEELLALAAYFGESTVRGATCLASLGSLYALSGRNHLARDAMQRAITIFDDCGEEEQAAEARMGLGVVLLALGEVERSRQMLEGQIAYFTRIGRPDRVAACEYNRANVAVMRGDFAAADRYFDAAAAGLTEAGLHHQLSRLQWCRVKRLTMEAAVDPAKQATLGAEAVDTAIASLIAADYERFQFVESWRRAQWLTTLEHRMTMTFALAYSLGSASLTADLIETVLNAGVYTTGHGSAETDSVEELDLDPGVRRVPAGDADDRPAALMLGAAATLLSTAELPMSPPPALVAEDGRVLLARQRQMAAALDPELAATLGSAPRVAPW